MWTRLVDVTVAIGEWVLDRLDRWVARASLIGNAPLLDPTEFAWTRALEAGWPEMRAELDRLLVRGEALPNFQDISTDQATITDDDRWKTYFLYGFGFRSDANCARCPETARLVAAVPGLQTAMFSILAPGKHIPEHCGPYKGLVRYHLGLKVPADTDRCRIRIDDRIATWSEGASLMFDDTYEHEVWNDTEEERVVLFLDIVRPLQFPMNHLNAFVLRAIAISPFVADAKRRQREWEDRFNATAAMPAPPSTVRARRRAATSRSSSEE
ncbi:MAG: aspartyl/asparaginyl beta-hydroxylase domain-containing protein [Acidimicrobiia bacterium]